MPAADPASLLATPTPAALGKSERAGVKSVAEVTKAARAAAAATGIDAVRRDALLGLALCWHDQWDAAHNAVQAHEGDRECDYVHAILHRREGDRGNCKYWLGAVGEHPVHHRLMVAARAVDLKLESQGRFDPAAFADACIDYATGPKRGETLPHQQWSDDLVAVQKTEFELLAAHLLAPGQ